MTTIPASAIVNTQPGVVSAGGSSFAMNGLALTNSTRVPIGQVISLAPSAVSNYFGPNANETAFATVYGSGFTGAAKLPGSLLFTQYPTAAVAAWLRGGSVAALGLAGLQALPTGSLNVVVDGYAHAIASISLATYNSQSAMAAAITAAFTDPTEASFTASIGGSMLTCTTSGTTLTIGTVGSGSIWPGDFVSGTDGTHALPSGCYIVSKLSGTDGGSAGATYQLSAAAGGGNMSSATVTVTSAVLDVTVCATPSIAVGQTVVGTSVTGTPVITSQLTGTAGGVGTYQLSSAAQRVASEAMTAIATAPVVTYDSVSGGFVITSGITGAASSMAYATGTLAASLMLTLATGAVLSQGAVAATPSAFMTNVVQQATNWATFTTLFDPDNGSGNAQKLLFAAWNSAQNNQFAYVAWDTDQSPVVSAPATSCLTYLAGPSGANYSGTMPISEPANYHLAAFAMSYPACLDFGAKNGRYTMMFRGQAGLTASVSTTTARANLLANGYNFLGAYANRTQTNIFWEPGSILGPFKWYDSYICQMQINTSLQSDILAFLQQIGTFPYNTRGYGLLQAACMNTINGGLNFGSIVAGVTLSESQIAYANNLAGKNIASTLSQRGWYLLIQDASAAVRIARQSPPITFMFCDGESVQYININSLSVQ